MLNEKQLKLIQCMDVDVQNMPENGFKNAKEILDFYMEKTEKEIDEIHNDYYGNEDNEK